MAVNVPFTKGFVQECNSQGLSNTQAAVLLELSLEKNAAANEILVSSGSDEWDAGFLHGMREMGFTVKQANVIMDYALQLMSADALVKQAAANHPPYDPERSGAWYNAWAADAKARYGVDSLIKCARPFKMRPLSPEEFRYGWGPFRTDQQWENFRNDKKKFADERAQEAQKALDNGSYGFWDAMKDIGRGIFANPMKGDWSDVKRGFKNLFTGGWNTAKNIGNKIKNWWKGLYNGKPEEPPQRNMVADTVKELETANPNTAAQVNERAYNATGQPQSPAPQPASPQAAPAPAVGQQPVPTQQAPTATHQPAPMPPSQAPATPSQGAPTTPSPTPQPAPQQPAPQQQPFTPQPAPQRKPQVMSQTVLTPNTAMEQNSFWEDDEGNPYTKDDYSTVRFNAYGVPFTTVQNKHTGQKLRIPVGTQMSRLNDLGIDH